MKFGTNLSIRHKDVYPSRLPRIWRWKLHARLPLAQSNTSLLYSQFLPLIKGCPRAMGAMQSHVDGVMHQCGDPLATVDSGTYSGLLNDAEEEGGKSLPHPGAKVWRFAACEAAPEDSMALERTEEYCTCAMEGVGCDGCGAARNPALLDEEEEERTSTAAGQMQHDRSGSASPRPRDANGH